MTVFLTAGLLLGAGFMYWLRGIGRPWQLIVDGVGVIAYIGFTVEISRTVIRVLADDAVFMTQVHEVLLSTLFLLSGAYIGMYGLSRLYESVRFGRKM
ncbi:hypothetical protein [Paenibacillus spongiae]|uniref:Transposase n=1 Tax=Paenibacillus spongiae TaxID=2909671 RepID=A0ABY5S7Z3_9BACL|nr:hypothetical protein [Paenibacillus spongiae]UVI28665.1 hypothetical protein L1F29_24950 [Paenibacillus spongiae]